MKWELSRWFGVNRDEEYFTLDPQGRPRFFFRDTAGVMNYASCDRNCTQAANWNATPIGTPGFEPFNFELTYDRNGHPRMSFVTQPRVRETFIGFAMCDVNCASASNWSVLTHLARVGVGYDHSLVVDSRGRPRLAFYTGGYPEGPTPYDNRLIILWCDVQCAANTRNWSPMAFELPASYGEDVELALDGQDRPRLVYYVRGGEGNVYGLGYAWCTANCTASHAIWYSTMLITTQRLDLLEPQRKCSWLYAGEHPSLAIDPAGNPVVAYDGEVICNEGSAGRRIRITARPQP